MKTNTQKRSSKKAILVISSIAILVTLIVLSLLNLNKILPTTDSSKNLTNSDSQQIDKLSSNPENKENPSNTDTPTPPLKNEETGKSTVELTVSTSITNGQVSIRGGINNAVVENGVCYAQLVDTNGQVVRKETTLLQNASTTDCKTISFSTAELSAGTWKVTLYYKSDTLEGMSNATTIEI